MSYTEKAGNLLPPKPERYPGLLVMAISHLREAAHLIDECSVSFRDFIPLETSIVLGEIRDELWQQNGLCCDALFEILRHVDQSADL